MFTVRLPCACALTLGFRSKDQHIGLVLHCAKGSRMNYSSDGNYLRPHTVDNLASGNV